MKGLRTQMEAAGGDPSGLITWNGECIPCLGIFPKMNLNKVVYIIAEKLCELATPLDLSTLSLECALEILDREETGDRTLAKVLQLLLDNDCKLAELIEAIDGKLNNLANKTLVLDLKCLATFDSFGNQLPYNEQTVLQSLISEVCTLKTQMTTVAAGLAALKTKVDNLVIPSGDEVEIGTCINPVVKPVSQAVIEVSADYCDYKAVLGTKGEFQTAMSRQTQAINTVMGSTNGWITTPTTDAQSQSNQWLLLQYLLTNVQNINKNCCNNTCDDITVGFITSFEGNTVILQFTNGSGTKIPVGFTDCGSTVVIKNQLGVQTLELPIIISQGGETDALDLSMFEKGDTLTFDIDVKMCSETDECQKCVSKVVKYTSDCCIITNISTEAITIVYNTTVTPITTS